MIEAVIFDMDGLLIDSEPFWEEAEVAAFRSVGIPFEPEMTSKTMGWRIDEVVAYWHRQLPWETPAKEEVVNRVIQNVVSLVKEKGIAREGVNKVISYFAGQQVPMAIASSSPTEIIAAVVEKLSLSQTIMFAYSAEHEPYGKPHPGIFLTTAHKLSVLPERCLVFEDSPSGVLAAKAAKMTCIAVPDRKVIGHNGFAIADIVLSSLSDFTPDILAQLEK